MSKSSGCNSLIGLTQKETERFSLWKLVASLAAPTDNLLKRAAGFEVECCQAAGSGTHGMYALPAEISGIGVQQLGSTMATETAGGFLRGKNVSAEVIGNLRPNGALFELATKVENLLPGDHILPRFDSSLAGGWVRDDEDAPDSTPDYGALFLTAKTAAARTTLSRSFLNQGAAGAEVAVRTHLQRALTDLVEAALWSGQGGRWTPLGILATSGIGSVLGGENGAAPTWSNLVALETALAEDDACTGRLALVTNAKVRSVLKQTCRVAGDSASGFCWGPFPGSADPAIGMANGYSAHVSNACPSTLTKGNRTDCSPCLMGNFEDLIVAIWGGIEISVDPYSSKAGAVELTAFMDVDSALRHPESFAAMQDCLTT
jgi:HK97 family phage major capsid protein